MSLDASSTSLVALIAAMVAVVALILGLLLTNRIAKMRRDYRLLQAADGTDSFIEIVARKTEEVALLQAEVEQLGVALQRTRADLAQALRHVSVVRYDAFADMGGRMSFSAALTDDHADGIILTTIHARSESRTYIKGIRRGEADVLLSPEERQALDEILRSLP
jgi:hypothetical protein